MNLRNRTRDFLDLRVKPYAKAIVAACGLAVTLAAGTPLADDVDFIVQAVIAALTLVGVYSVPNVPADE